MLTPKMPRARPRCSVGTRPITQAISAVLAAAVERPLTRRPAVPAATLAATIRMIRPKAIETPPSTLTRRRP